MPIYGAVAAGRQRTIRAQATDEQRIRERDRKRAYRSTQRLVASAGPSAPSLLVPVSSGLQPAHRSPANTHRDFFTAVTTSSFSNADEPESSM